MSTLDRPAFLRKLRTRDREHSPGWLTECPDKHASSGFPVLVQPDEQAGRYRFTCLEATNGAVCGNERDLVRLLGLSEAEIRLVGAGRLTVTPLSEIAMRSITWLEKPLWQRSAFQLLAAPKGAGKGTYNAGLAARVSRAGENVLFISTEDSASIDLKPRLVAAGADVDRHCYLIRQHVQLPDDVDEIRGLALDIGGVGLIVIDPVANHIGAKNSNSDAEVRHAIAPLNKLADELDCLLIGVRHPGKDRSRGAVASILGSTAWADTPRAVVMIAVDDEDPHVRHIQVVTGNRSANGAAQAFRIDAVPVPGLAEPITLAVALGESAKSVDELLAGPSGGAARVSSDELQSLIVKELGSGDKSRDYLDAVALDELGARPDTVYKSGLDPLRKAGRAKARKAGLNDGWYWRLTEEETS